MAAKLLLVVMLLFPLLDVIHGQGGLRPGATTMDQDMMMMMTTSTNETTPIAAPSMRQLTAASCSTTTNPPLLCRLEFMDMEMMPDEEDTSEVVVDEEHEAFVCQVWQDDENIGHYDVDLTAFPEISQAYHESFTNDSRDDEDATHHLFVVEITHACVDELQASIVLTPASEMNILDHHDSSLLPMHEVSRHLQRNHDHDDERNQETSLLPLDDDHDHHHHRHLAAASGTHTLVVIRVVYNNTLVPSLSTSQLRGRIFGRGPEAVSVTPRTQLLACSGRQFRLTDFQGRHIENGILEIHLPEMEFGDKNPVRQLENAVMSHARQKVGRNIKYADHVMIVLPNVNDIVPGKGFLAYAYLYGAVSVFNNIWAGYYSALAHELGHNFGLHHSGWGKYTYKDTTGTMGYSKRQVSGPKVCFNAQKNYLLGWYESRTRRLDSADLPWTGKLAFFGDYLWTDMDEPVLIHLSRPGNRLFIQYNRASGMNSGTPLKPDRVVIVKDKGNPGDKKAIPSTFRGALPIGGNGYFRIPNYVKPYDLVIHVCGRTNLNRPPYLRMSIYIDDGIQKPSCNDLPLPPYCDDNMTVKFYVDAATGYKDCAWLKQNLDTRGAQLCHVVHPARNYCAETCGKCTDSCEDSEGSFYVNEALGKQNCTWLSDHHDWQDRLCYSGNKAFNLCHESCDRCD